MPKARVDRTMEGPNTSAGVSRTPVKINTTSTPLWYKIIMFGLMLLGIAWLVVNYIAGSAIPFMVALHAWNYVIGFGLLIIGLLMTMGWR
ncbi:septation inhibitor protein [Corynebacterium sphenisci DSM 44792]|uniref:Cell division protein CrgA n=1 Tax=Corynebacterium sphenisci DSM 44792 TaxID=1437874 RepID=A0A1L7CVC9_9CORY|nr:cell division protein CrgA [Corynebacterium sphenisci]APT89767.1 septation inhibitor protein [Corynebacterium sphenisci DSM 44792]